MLLAGHVPDASQLVTALKKAHPLCEGLRVPESVSASAADVVANPVKRHGSRRGPQNLNRLGEAIAAEQHRG